LAALAGAELFFEEGRVQSSASAAPADFCVVEMVGIPETTATRAARTAAEVVVAGLDPTVAGAFWLAPVIRRGAAEATVVVAAAASAMADMAVSGAEVVRGPLHFYFCRVVMAALEEAVGLRPLRAVAFPLQAKEAPTVVMLMTLATAAVAVP
jgi:hypothetical protein